MPEKVRILLFALVPIGAALALSACGGDGDSASAAGGDDRQRFRAEFREAQLKFARCMRAEGLDFPDPKVSNGPGGGFTIMSPPRQGDTSKFRRAEGKCRHFLADVKPPELSKEQEEEFFQRALAHARCMRKEGVNFPDPQRGADGGVQVRIRGRRGAAGPDGPDPRSPKFRRAFEKCRATMPGGAGGPGEGPRLETRGSGPAGGDVMAAP